MAGTAILSGSLIVPEALRLVLNHSVHRTVASVIEKVKDSVWGNDEATRRQRCVLLVYSLYALLMDSPRYQNKFLLPLCDPEGLNHGFTDIGDIALSDEDGDLFECAGIVVGASLSTAFVAEAYAKVQPYTPRRFCLLALDTFSSAKLSRQDLQAIERLTQDIYRTHGCEVIVDSLMRTLNSGLHFLAEPADFLAVYSQALREDEED
jgi:DNA (cytosine-5)-methyltransferase 1